MNRRNLLMGVVGTAPVFSGSSILGQAVPKIKSEGLTSAEGFSAKKNTIIGSKSVLEDFYGIHIGRLSRHYPPQVPLYDAGQSWMRLWDTMSTWKLIEPVRGRYNWTILEESITRCKDKGLKVLLTLGQAPDWASGCRTESWSQYSNAPPLDVIFWKEYVTAIVDKFGASIDAYEIWNEADTQFSWTGSVRTMVSMCEIAFNVIKGAHPRATVVAPSITNPNGYSWLREFLSLGGGEYCDALAFHPYAVKAPEVYISLCKLFERNVRASSSVKPYWITEVGYTHFYDLDGNTYHGTYMPADQAASYAARMALVAAVLGTDHFFSYRVDDGSVSPDAVMALRFVDPKDFSKPYPALTAWAIPCKLLGGSRQITLEYREAEGVPYYKLSADRGGGMKLFCYWTNDWASRTISADESGASRGKLTDTFGQIIRPDGDRLNISMMPVYVESQG